MSRDALEQIQASMSRLSDDEIRAIMADQAHHGMPEESALMQACRGLLEKRELTRSRLITAADCRGEPRSFSTADEFLNDYLAWKEGE